MNPVDQRIEQEAKYKEMSPIFRLMEDIRLYNTDRTLTGFDFLIFDQEFNALDIEPVEKYELHNRTERTFK